MSNSSHLRWFSQAMRAAREGWALKPCIGACESCNKHAHLTIECLSITRRRVLICLSCAELNDEHVIEHERRNMLEIEYQQRKIEHQLKMEKERARYEKERLHLDYLKFGRHPHKTWY